MPKPSRRDFLKDATSLAAGAVALDWGRESFASGPNLIFPTVPRERLAVASWPFRMFIEAPANQWARDPKLPGMDLKDFGAVVVQKFGLHNIEPLDMHFRSTDASYLHEFRAANEKARVRIVNIPLDPRESFYSPDPTRRRKAVEVARKWVDIAVALDSPSLRIHIAGVSNVQPDVGRTAESLKRVADYAAAKNVLVNLENDDNYTEDPFFIVEVLDKVANPYLHALPDFCNSMLTHSQEFNNRAMEAMFKRAYNISHVKDSEAADQNKFVTVDVAKCFEMAKASVYRGYFSMEWEGRGEPYAGTQKLIDLSLRYLV